jgi:hypothetical protein
VDIKTLVHAKMPDANQVVYGSPYREEPKPVKTINDLKVGQTAYCQPWSIFVEFSNNTWIHRGYPISSKKTVEFCVKVQRRENGYAIDISQCKGYRWTPLERFKIQRGDFVGNVCEISPS